LIIDLAIVLATVIGMEVFAALVHRHVMHGRLGWRLHRDHHEPDDGWFERNDIYAIGFAGIVVALFVAGARTWPLTQIALGMSLYGVLYFVVHDGLVHKRWPFRHVPRKGYLRRLYQAHRLHHATKGRTGAVSFGFLYAPPLKTLLEQGSRRKRRSSTS
jgi:beta-carotene 3-hydroxylase